MNGAGHFRASRTDREQVVDELKIAFVQERLTKDELDDRVGRALAARTFADLGALTADLPALPALPVKQSARAQPMRLRDYTGVKVGAGGVGLVTLVMSAVVGVLAGPGLAIGIAIASLIFSAIIAGFVALLIAAAVKFDSRQRHRQLPPASGAASSSARRPRKPRRNRDDGLALVLLS
jgi:hypothetical protein